MDALHIPLVKMARSPFIAFPKSVISACVFSVMLVGLMPLMVLLEVPAPGAGGV
jgi:hypothetical protein